MPAIAPSYVNANKESGDTSRRRKDGFVRILDYDHDKQAWGRKDVGTYEDVYNIFETPDGAQRKELVSAAVKLG